eukprot:5789587-Pyramimonas_sp.AAC.1
MHWLAEFAPDNRQGKHCAPPAPYGLASGRRVHRWPPHVHPDDRGAISLTISHWNADEVSASR